MRVERLPLHDGQPSFVLYDDDGLPYLKCIYWQGKARVGSWQATDIVDGWPAPSKADFSSIQEINEVGPRVIEWIKGREGADGLAYRAVGKTDVSGPEYTDRA